MRETSALDALFPKIRQGILAATVMQPDRWWFLSDLARHLGVTPSSLQRELKSLVNAEILTRRQEGKQVYFQPNPECPFLAELQGLMAKTAGLTDILKEALEPLAEAIDCAFIFGSLARSEEHSASDVDLMIIGRIGLAMLSPVLRDAEERLNRPVNPTVYLREEFADKIKARHHFLSAVLKGKKLFIIGNKDDLAAASGKRPRPSVRDKQAGT
jgi:predicted nucleotidyltransferase